MQRSKILAELLATSLALVVRDAVKEAHTSVIQRKFMYHILHLMNYIIEKVAKSTGTGSYQSEPFYRIDQLYLATVLKSIDVGFVSRCKIATIHGSILFRVQSER